jgi:iron(III) transport system ATP-binding protein
MRFEVRRLHDAYRYTTIYVTHDQSEAMTTADLIAVMNAGRIEQLGTPQEVYDAPRSEFVARFLGGSNIIRGMALDANHIGFAGASIKCRGGPLEPGTEAALSIRPHEVALYDMDPPQAAGNVVEATVVRNVFLGSARDYVVAVIDGTQLRISAPPELNLAPGRTVWAVLPAQRCRALMG